MFFFFNQFMVQPIIETVKAPSQRPEIVSSTPIQRDIPTAEAAATVQTGQKAMADLVESRK